MNKETLESDPTHKNLRYVENVLDVGSVIGETF
jgi:hypothetical protein